MSFRFKSVKTTYTDALDGDIIQIDFDESLEDDPFNPKFCSLSLSVNYEFPPAKLSAEWCDGIECHGGIDVSKYRIGKGKLHLWIGMEEIEVDFEVEESTFEKIRSLLLREWGESANV